MFIKNEEADRLAEALRAEFDVAKRQEIARRFQEIIYQEQPYLFFRSSVGVLSWRQQVGGGAEQTLRGIEWVWITYPFYSRDSARWHLTTE